MSTRKAFCGGVVICTMLSLACTPSPPKTPSGPGSTAGSQATHGGQNPPSECTCVEYPFPPQCDTQCGMAEYIVKNVNPANNTVDVAPPDRPAEVRTIALSSLQPAQASSLEAGSQIRVLFKKANNAQLKMTPLRIMKVQPAK